MALAARAAGWLARQWWQWPPSATARALQPLAWLYLAGLRWQRRCIPAQQLPVAVLVVGNWVVGGAGKTPTVIAVVQALQAAGRRPGVVSRGYGRQSDTVRGVAPGDSAALVGDEPLLISRRTGVPVWVGQRRVAAAAALCAAHPECDVIVADDGLQHPALGRDAALVVFDERGAGNGLLLPAGPLREPLPAGLTAETHVLYTAGAPSTPLPGASATRLLAAAWPLAAWHEGNAGLAQPLHFLRGRPLLAAAGLAAPEKFFSMLRAAGLHIEPLPLPDHYRYDTLPWPADTADVVTTEKDAVKLAPGLAGATRIWVLPLDLALPDGLIGTLVAQLPLHPRRPAP